MEIKASLFPLLMIVLTLASLCPAEDPTCNETFTNTEEYKENGIGYCVQTCQEAASAEGCTATETPNNTIEVACFCKDKLGDVQMHIGADNKTITYSAVVCNPGDYSPTCVEQCKKSPFGEDYSTPYKCKAFLFPTDKTGQLSDNSDVKQSFCGCGANMDPVPATVPADNPTCDETFTNTEEYMEKPIGFCVQTCQEAASAEGCTATKTPKNTIEVACFCKDKLGDVQMHMDAENKTTYSAVVCNPGDYSTTCVEQCKKSPFGEDYSTPYKCKAFLFPTDEDGQLSDNSDVKQSFCGCGANMDPVPATVPVEQATPPAGTDAGTDAGGDASDAGTDAKDAGEDAMGTSSKTKRGVGNSKGRGRGKGQGKGKGRGKGQGKGKGRGKGKGQGKESFPKILDKIYNALKYVQNYFRQNQG